MNAHVNELRRGWQLQQQGQLQEAETIYRKVLKSAPNDSNAWCYLGIVLHDLRRYREAVDAYRKALHYQPKFPVALNNLGNSLRYTGAVVEADDCFQRALDLKPDYLNAYKNRGTLHVWSGSLDKGLQYYQQALQLNAQDAELHRNLGVIYLLRGDFERGWPEYRWRWKVGDLHRPFTNVPVWRGEDLRGRTIVLTAEQGLGDTIHFVRFAKVLTEKYSAQVTIYCQPALLALLQAARLSAVYPNNLPLQQPVDFQCSLLDVADVLQVDAGSVPNDCPYLVANERLVPYWQSQLQQAGLYKDLGRDCVGDRNPSGDYAVRGEGRLKVGIAWQGNPEHQADAFRSVPLRCFERLTESPNVDLISLQSGFGVEQLEAWQGQRPITILPNVDQSGGAFMDTAAIMKSLDLVVTSDTAIAHLAASLGVPTWIVLGYVPDWRWLLDREDSPWYPSVRLFRQTSMGDWASVFDRVASELTALV